ncbi:GDSL-type esterase/lipase family protein [Paenibacillus sp. CN-4]|uniref:GDSL-type esterase/lipase family protein n=1 Tax=Paenibacillus nanchangensis TaxID=3348343 RepID=UPI00397CEAA9
MSKKLKKALFILSVTVNLLLLGGLGYVFVNDLGLDYLFQKRLDIKNQDRLAGIEIPDKFDIYPTNIDPIIMLGDDITEGINWSEFIGSKVVGRGVEGETTQNIIDRLDSIASNEPSQVFILAGVNDFAKVKTEKSAEQAKQGVIRNYQMILERIKKSNPQTGIYVQSILPVNTKISFFFYKDINELIKETNKELKETAEEFGATYINLFDSFYDGGNLYSNYTVDGVQLTSLGYLKWKEIVTPYMNQRVQ